MTYIRSLLDVTDNLVDGEVVHPERVRVRDEDDTYLVVAADKGTATFSDTANAVARRVRVLARRRVRLRRLGRLRPQEARDHRARRLGVGQAPLPRARDGPGARRVHRRSGSATCPATCSATGCCCRTRSSCSPPTTTGTCSSTRTRTPRRRSPSAGGCSSMPGSSWDDYDREVLSEGGGVYRRDAKWIELSDRARELLGLDEERVAPNDVIRAILRAQVDLLWNGGIGTVVKASTRERRRRRATARATRSASTPASCAAAGRGRGRQPRLHAPRAGRVRRPAAASSTPTSSTTRPASTAPTTRST